MKESEREKIIKRNKYERETRLKDDWRYLNVGTDTYKIDNSLNYNPEDDYIAMLDGEEEPNLSPWERTELPPAIELIECLDERKKQIVFLYYWEGKSFSKIGRLMGFTKQRAHQLFGEAIEEIKENVLTSQNR